MEGWVPVVAHYAVQAFRRVSSGLNQNAKTSRAVLAFGKVSGLLRSLAVLPTI